MADITIAPFDTTTDSSNIQIPLRGTASGDIDTNGVSVTSADTLIIQAEFNNDIEIFVDGASGGGTVTVEAGDYPPSPHAEKGDATFDPTANQIIRFIPEAGRHTKADGSIHVTVSATMDFWVFRAPAGFIGVGITNRFTIPAMPTN